MAWEVNYTPEDIDFSRPLHQQELLPDKHVQCFRDFEPWMKTKADFVKKPCAETPAELKLEEYDGLLRQLVVLVVLVIVESLRYLYTKFGPGGLL